MIAIDNRDFEKFIPLFNDYGPNQAVVDATLAGLNPGWLWADKNDPSKASLLLTRYGFVFGWGEPLSQWILQLTQ